MKPNRWYVYVNVYVHVHTRARGLIFYLQAGVSSDCGGLFLDTGVSSVCVLVLRCVSDFE